MSLLEPAPFSDNISSLLDDTDLIQFLSSDTFTFPELEENSNQTQDFSFDTPIPEPNSYTPSPQEVYIKEEKNLESPQVDPNSVFPSLSVQPTFAAGSDDTKVSKRATQNRVASRKYRKRKKQYVEDLEEQLRQLILENQKLRREQYMSQVQINLLVEENDKHHKITFPKTCKSDPFEESDVLGRLESQLASGATNEDLYTTLTQISSMCSKSVQDALANLRTFITPSFLIHFSLSSSNSIEEEEGEQSLRELTDLFRKEALPSLELTEKQMLEISATYPVFKQQFSQLKMTRKNHSDQLRKYLIQRYIARSKVTPQSNLLKAVDAIIGSSPITAFNMDGNPRLGKRICGTGNCMEVDSDQAVKIDGVNLQALDHSISELMELMRQNLLDEQSLYVFYFRQMGSIFTIPQQAFFVLFLRKRKISCSTSIKVLWLLFSTETPEIGLQQNELAIK